MRYLLTLILVLFAGSALAEKRVAFLVGNSAYSHASSLKNPVKDVQLVASTLSDLGFSVTQHTDLTRNEIGRELSTFLRNTAGADVTIFYFAGHGMQFEGRNYLVGTDAQLKTEFDIDSEALQLDKIITLLERNSRAALVFVDACRDNPLANAFYTENFSGTRALATRGLAPVSGAYQGSMITFSASPGQVAYDGEDENSPFAAALARHLPTENLEVLSLMKRVIRDVKSDTKDLQTPMVTNDLTTEIYLRLGETGAGDAIALQQERALFDAASELGSLRAWDIYLERYPEGELRELALSAWGDLQNQQVAALDTDVPEQSTTRDSRAEIDAVPSPTLSDTAQIQTALNRLGYNAGPADGVMGSKTRLAIASYQSAVGLQSTGAMTAETARRLGLLLGSFESDDRPILSSRDARRYDPDQLALIESDSRLLKAVKALSDYEIVYGYYEGRVFLGVLTWTEMRWDKVRELVATTGGHLATMTTPAEAEFVFNLIRHDDRFWIKKSYGINGPYFGLYQKEGAREPFGGWTWVTGEPADYLPWNAGQPNNGNNTQHWGHFTHRPGNHTPHDPVEPANFWTDSDDRIRRAFIIEIE